MITKPTPSSIIILLGFLFYFLFDAHAQYFNRIHQVEGLNNHSVIFNSDTIIFMGEGHLRTNFTDRYIDTYYLFKTDITGNTLQERMFGFVYSNTNYNIFDTYNYNRLYKHYNKLIITGFGRDTIDVGLPSPYYSNPLFVSMHGLNTDSILTRKWRNYSTTNPVYYIGHSVVSIDSNKIGVWLQASLNREVNNDYTTPDTAWLYILNTAHNLDIIRAIPFTPTLPGNIFIDIGNTIPNSAIIDNDKNIYLIFKENDLNYTTGRLNYYKIDTMGNILTEKHLSNTENPDDRIGWRSFGINNNGNVILSGMKITNDGATCAFQILDNTTLNPIQWVYGDVEAPIGGALAPNGFKKVVQSPTGYYYTIHDNYDDTQSYATGAVISKFTSTGQLVWKHNYTPANLPGGNATVMPRISEAASLFDLALHPNGNLLVACGQTFVTNTAGNSPRGYHGWILGVDTMGCEVQNCFTGVDETPLSQGKGAGVEVKLYPNPAHDFVNIEISPPQEGLRVGTNRNLTLYNTEGKAVPANIRWHHAANVSSSQQETHEPKANALGDVWEQSSRGEVNIQHLPRGLYFVKIGNHTATFVKE